VPAAILVNLPITVGSTSVNNGTNGKLLNVTAGKVGEVTIDTTPSDGSTNPINSNAVFDGLALKQPTLVSATNIKTVNGNSLLGSGDLVISGGGGTPAGITGQIQFNNAGAFGADSGLFWDNTNKRLGIGATPATTVRLDVRAQGALSTDIAFRVRNSADTDNIALVRGDGSVSFKKPGSFTSTAVTFDFDYLGTKTAFEFVSIYQNNFARKWRFNSTYSNLNGSGLVISDDSAAGSASIFEYRLNNFALGGDGTLFKNAAGSGQTVDRGVLWLKTATAPIDSVADVFKFYSADITAGNAAPHFRTENGGIIKLYQETTAITAATFVANTGNYLREDSTFDGYTMKQVVKALRNMGILA
jgi:hypothetical protein